MEPEVFASLVKCCNFCGSMNSTFAYLNNGKHDQPRYRCKDCRHLFAIIYHNRPQGKKYTKERGKDPKELQDLPRQCPRCGAADTPFMFYNNKSLLQPRFNCTGCNEEFSMRLVTRGKQSHLVHTNTRVRTCNPKPRSSRPSQKNQPTCYNRSVQMEPILDMPCKNVEQGDLNGTPVPMGATEEAWSGLNEPFISPTEVEGALLMDDELDDIIMAFQAQEWTEEELDALLGQGGLENPSDPNHHSSSNCEDDLKYQTTMNHALNFRPEVVDNLDDDLLASKSKDESSVEAENGLDDDEFASQLEEGLLEACKDNGIVELAEDENLKTIQQQREYYAHILERTRNVAWLPPPTSKENMAIREMLKSY
jgi:transposase-like protein